MSNHHYVVAAAVLVAALLLVGCAANNSNGREDQAQPAATGMATSSSAPTPSPSESPRWGHYGEPAATPGPGAFSGWSHEEQEHAQEFALASMQVFAMKTDQETWHEYMDPRVTDEYKEQLKNYNPQYGNIRSVQRVVYTEFGTDATKATLRVETSDGVWVVHLVRSGAGQEPKVALIEPLSLGGGH